MDLAFGNVSVVAIAMAVLAGTAVGYTISLLLRPAPLTKRPVLIAWQTGLSLAWIGFLFYSTQTVGAYFSSDPLWPRIFGRFAMWVLMSGTTSVALWILLERRRRRFERNR